MALVERMESGKGKLVSNSLYRQGIFCNAAELLREKRPLQADKRISQHVVPDYTICDRKPQEPLYGVFSSNDREHFSLLAPVGTSPSALASALGCDATAEAIRAALASRPWSEIHAILVSTSIPFFKKEHYSTNPSAHSGIQPCLAPLDGVPDCAAGIPKIPFEFSCSTQHRAGYMAASLGVHTQAFLNQGWSERCSEAFLSCAGKVPKKVVVLELSEARTSAIAAGTRQFRASFPAGAAVQVIQVAVPELDPEYWSRQGQAYADFLSTGKQLLRVDSLEALRRVIEQLASANDVDLFFCTNVRVSALKQARLDTDV